MPLSLAPVFKELQVESESALRVNSLYVVVTSRPIPMHDTSSPRFGPTSGSPGFSAAGPLGQPTIQSPSLPQLGAYARALVERVISPV
jgi:hypothetical protein